MAVENLDIFEKLLCTRSKFRFNKKIRTKLTFLPHNCIVHSLCVGWRNLPTLRVGWRSGKPLQTDGRTDGWRNEYTRFAWAGGTCPCFAWAGGTFSPVVQFLVLAGNRFWFYILLMYSRVSYHTVVVLCQFFVSGGK